MGIHRIAVLDEEFVNALHGFVLVGATREEGFLQELGFLARDRVFSPLGKRLHPLRRNLCVPARKLEDKPFQIGGNENIHRRRHGFIKRTLAVVSSAFEKIGEHVVAVGRADELPDGQPHFSRVVRRQNIAEIPRGHGEIHFVAVFDLPGGKQVAISRKIVRDLRNQPPDIDRVCGGEHVALVGKLLFAFLGGENAFYARLAVVEIALHGNDVYVVPLRGTHLQFLHFGNALVGIKGHHLYPVRVLEAFERGFARVPAGGGEHENFFFNAR